ncbi:MAG: hypothetical protein ABEK04_05355 [Candidatus Nanohalobium sp.]
MPEEKRLDTKQGLKELAEAHLELGSAERITGQQLFNYLREEGYSIEHVDSETENYFSDKDTGLKQVYEVGKEGETYELHVEKEKGRLENYWFES